MAAHLGWAVLGSPTRGAPTPQGSRVYSASYWATRRRGLADGAGNAITGSESGASAGGAAMSAAARGATLLVTPELALTGYDIGDLGDDLTSPALVDAAAAVAKEVGIGLLSGSPCGRSPTTSRGMRPLPSTAPERSVRHTERSTSSGDSTDLASPPGPRHLPSLRSMDCASAC